jgi:hypothetical protein
VDRQSWDPVVDRLAREREVITVDLPDHGADYLLLPPEAKQARRSLRAAKHVWLLGCCHVQMSDAPDLVAEVFLEGNAPRAVAYGRPRSPRCSVHIIRNAAVYFARWMRTGKRFCAGTGDLDGKSASTGPQVSHSGTSGVDILSSTPFLLRHHRREV